MGTIKEDLAKLLKLRQFKADYLAKIEAIKQGEEVLTKRILKALEDNGVDSIRVDVLGHALRLTERELVLGHGELVSSFLMIDSADLSLY